MDRGRQFNNTDSQIELHHEEFHKHLKTNQKAWEVSDIVNTPELQAVKEKSASRARLHSDHYQKLTGKSLISENDICPHCGESTERDES
jgi:hypothetical protein